MTTHKPAGQLAPRDLLDLPHRKEPLQVLRVWSELDLPGRISVETLTGGDVTRFVFKVDMVVPIAIPESRATATAASPLSCTEAGLSPAQKAARTLKMRRAAAAGRAS